jgi:type III pantothenate kinase
MDLLIDIGNTNLRWAALGNDPTAGPQAGPVLGEVSTLRHHGAIPIDLLAAWDGLPAPRKVLVGNVGGAELATHLTRAVRSLWGLDPAFAATRADGFGVRIAYAEPGRLGVDRWLALIAVHRHAPGPSLVIDAGTAITYDLLLGDGTHLGGLILPGVRMLREALIAGTRIPPWADQPDPGPGDPAWATDTAGAVAGASLQGPSALAERLWMRLRGRAGTEPRLILTGGDAERLAPLVGVPVRILPALVLQGLALLA